MNYVNSDEETKDESVVRHNRAPFPKALFGTVAVAALMIAGVLTLYKNRAPVPVEKEESFETARGKLELPNMPVAKTDGRLKMPEPPPSVVTPLPQPTPPVVIQQPGAPIDDGEAARKRAEEERLRKEREAIEARLRSKILIVDDSSVKATAVNDIGGSGSSIVKSEAAEDDPNKKFLASVSSAGVETSRAAQISRIDALVPQGAMIRASLETAIQSDLTGMVRAITSEDVYSFDGRRILIPKGSMLTGEYKSGLARGQTRVFIVWSRLLRSDGVSMALGSIGTDDLGRSGLTGQIDEHFVERFGSSVMLSMVGGVSAFISGLNKAGQTTTTGSGTGTALQAQSQAQQVAAQSMTEMANMALKDSVNIPPTVYVEQGTRIVVFVKRDLDFSALYPDPVKEALRALRAKKR